MWLWGILIIPLVMVLKKLWLRQRMPQNLINSIDKELLPHILVNSGEGHKHSGGWIYAVMTALVFIALANPRWDYTELNAYQPIASAVVLFDLSDPEYVVSGRQQIQDLLNNGKGLKVGLVAYAGIPHLVAPVTDDLQTLNNFLPALDNDLVTRYGNNLQAAINMGIELLDAEPGNNKSIVIVSGSDNSKNAVLDATKLKKSDYHLFVLGLGSKNISSLQNIAKLAKGSYITADHSERAVNAIIKKIYLQNNGKQEVSGKIIQWSDKYYWFLLPVAIMFLYVFRFGALLIFVISVMAPEVEAVEWFSNKDQQAMQAFKKTEFLEAADKFTDNYNKAVALYRAGEYAAAESLFKSTASVASIYNTGNAQMQQQKWQQAIDSYEKVLAEVPTHEDAQFNLEIAKKMLTEQQENKEQQEDQEEQQKQEGQNNQKQNNENNDSPQRDSQDANESDAANTDNGNNQAANQTKQTSPEQQDQNEDYANQDYSGSEDNEDAEHDQNEEEQAQPAVASTSDSKDHTGEIDNADLWLNRIDSDIKFLLRNKFYIEGMLHEQ